MMMAHFGALPQEVAEAAREKESQVHAWEPGLTSAPSSSMARLTRRSARSGCGGGGGGRRDLDMCAFKTCSVLPGRDRWMKRRNKRLATSWTDKLVSFIAWGTFKSGRIMRYLMHFWPYLGQQNLAWPQWLTVLPLKAGSKCDLGSIKSIGHRNATIPLSFKSCQAPEMARSIWRWLGNLIGVWHVNIKSRTWRMYKNTYMESFNMSWFLWNGGPQSKSWRS